MRNVVVFFSLFIAVACLTSSCGEQPSAAPSIERASEQPAAFKTVTKDNCAVRYQVLPESTRLNTPVAIPMDISADAVAEVTLGVQPFEKDFLVTQAKDTPEHSPDGGFRQHVTLTIEPLWHGDAIAVPELLVSLTFSNGRPPVILPVPGGKITVVAPTEEELAKPLNDIAARTQLVPPDKIPWLRYGIIAAASLIGVLLIWLICRLFRKKRRPQEAVLPAVPAHVRALKRLDDLMAQHLLETGQFKVFYDGISEILRDYIEDRFAFRAPEQTTEEFLANLTVNAMTFTSAQLRLLNSFLKHTDLVKYARVIPDSDSIAQTIADARSFIQETQSENTPLIV